MADTIEPKDAGAVAETRDEKAEPPPQAIAELYQMASHAAGLALQNAVHNQQALNQINSAIVSEAVELIMATGDKGGQMVVEAVAQPDAKVVGEAPAMVMGTLYQEVAHSTGILFENAVAAQQQQNALAQAATNQGVMQIYSLDTVAAEKAGQAGIPDDLA